MPPAERRPVFLDAPVAALAPRVAVAIRMAGNRSNDGWSRRLFGNWRAQRINRAALTADDFTGITPCLLAIGNQSLPNLIPFSTAGGDRAIRDGV
ncbi:MAG: hypothetical protein O3A84_02555 [Proteobacteria bacterium]|nr:hypothetical protein [Pseudomonadota bacterium]